MLNSKPNKRNKYKQGLFIPQNKSKVIKLNDQGGFYYRSGLELKLMIYFDTNPNILIWNPEIIKIPYLQNTFDNKKENLIKINFNESWSHRVLISKVTKGLD